MAPKSRSLGGGRDDEGGLANCLVRRRSAVIAGIGLVSTEIA